MSALAHPPGPDAFAVGDAGTIVHYNGTAWSPMASGTSDRLVDVWGSSGSDVIAAGLAATILHYRGEAIFSHDLESGGPAGWTDAAP